MTVVIEVELESEKERMAILRSVATCDQQTIRIMANRKVESQIYGSGLRGGLRLLALGWSGIHQKKLKSNGAQRCQYCMRIKGSCVARI